MKWLKPMQKITIIDSTLRDGSHAIRHQIPKNAIEDYAKSAESAGVEILVVGHGNGLSASSIHLGQSAVSDQEMLSTAKKELKRTKLAAFAIPGFATLRDIDLAVSEGVEVLFVASHCTEANVTKRYIKHSKVLTYGVLMMSHMADKLKLLEQAKLMENYGAAGVLLMDSAGAYLPEEVESKINFLANNLTIPVGFHAHNNLGMAVINSVVAVKNGATLIDATTRGFGAGAGNAQLEVVLAVLEKLGYDTEVDLYSLFKGSEVIAKLKEPQLISPLSIMSGLNGVFSGFAPLVIKAAHKYKVEASDIFRELGKRKVVAGQEDQIIEVAKFLKHE